MEILPLSRDFHSPILNNMGIPIRLNSSIFPHTVVL